MTIDLLPTLATLAGAELPKFRIDGKDIGPLLRAEPNAKTPHDAYYYYWGRELHAVRSGPWKLHFPHEYRTLNGRPGGKNGRPAKYDDTETKLALFNLETDIGETTDVSAKYPEEVARLEKLADAARDDLGDALQRKRGNGVRPPGKL